MGDPAEFEAAVKVAQPGDAIVLAAGVWQGADLVVTSNATKDHPLTIRAAKRGETVLSGRSRLRIAGEYCVVDGLTFRQAFHPDDLICFRRDSKQLAEHCRVTNCVIEDCHPDNDSTPSHWLSIYGAHNRVDHCRLQGKRNRGTTLVVWLDEKRHAQAAPEHLIDHNHFVDRPELKKNGGETIRIGDSKTSLINACVTVEHNLFERCNGEAEIISNKSCENIYRHNTLRACSGALTLRHGHRCRVEGNFFLGEKARGTGGVRVIGEDHVVVNNYFADLEGDDTRSGLSLMNGVPNSPLNQYAAVKRARVAFNTWVQCKRTIVIGLTDEDANTVIPPEDCSFTGNVILSRRGPLVEYRTPPTRLQASANLAFGAKLGIESSEGWEALDPQLELGDDRLWRPNATSPVTWQGGTNGELPPLDIDGQPRGTLPDRGCDQRSAKPVLFRPLQPGDVGPR